MKKFCIALALVSASLFMGSSAKADVIAELFDDFTAPAATGWSYLWNPAGVSIGDSANYLAIPLNGSTFNETTALEAVGTNGDNGNHVDLRVAGGTPSLSRVRLARLLLIPRGSALVTMPVIGLRLT